ncbi:zinc finger protein rotund-like [Schistocerca gregaria]|uniref:zinc finger protein rotund-like n=1 Tax=Schistocerca gregaria TaxID=7010 RepID=UPI00211F03DF|nr:zinc finger protein rotund-like [Schistocerca gregaria]XP_049833435.1 zinc finger protein rotund-like [Schistocerca gregaria]
MQRPQSADTVQARDTKRYKCTQCSKAFANSSYLTQHTRIHLGIKPYLCEICQRSFTQLSHLQQHIRTHTGDKPYKCPEPGCSKAFSQLSNLHSHSRCHQTDKPFKCNSCHKCFADEPSLIEHIPRHKESKHLKTHICQYCGKSYTQEVHLAKHMQKHADRTDKIPPLSSAEPNVPAHPQGSEADGYSAIDLQTYWAKVSPDFSNVLSEAAARENMALRQMNNSPFTEQRSAASQLRDLLEQGVTHQPQDEDTDRSGNNGESADDVGENLVTKDHSPRDAISTVRLPVQTSESQQCSVSVPNPTSVYSISRSETFASSNLPPFQTVSGLMHVNHLTQHNQHVNPASQVMTSAPQYLSYVAVPLPQHGAFPSTVSQFPLSAGVVSDAPKPTSNTFPNQLISLQQIKNYAQQPLSSSLSSERLLGIKEEID